MYLAKPLNQEMVLGTHSVLEKLIQCFVLPDSVLGTVFVLPDSVLGTVFVLPDSVLGTVFMRNTKTPMNSFTNCCHFVFVWFLIALII